MQIGKGLRAIVTLVLLAVIVPASGALCAELVMFDDPACVWCRKWLKEVGPGYPHTDEGRLAPLRRVDITAQKASGVALSSAVVATPTFVVTDDAGREVGRITGYPGPDFFYPSLDEILRKLPADAPKVPRQRETRLDAR